MEGTAQDPSNETMAYILKYGTVVEEFGHRIASPVMRVATDMNGTRLYLYAPRTAAAALIDFGLAVYRNLSKWYEADISQTLLDVEDADRILRT